MRTTATLAIAARRVGELCRVDAVARPRAGARIGIELWLPAPARWSGRYYQMGNGGFAGRIDRATLAAAARRGDAAAATDTGHTGDGFDARWAAGRPDLIADYAWRSIGETAATARALVAAYYGRAAVRRYFMGCSFGGRQALVAATRWPRDWDGVIAGAPAIDWADWLTGMARGQAALRAPGGWIAPERNAGLRANAASCRRRVRAGCPTPAQARSLAALDRAGYRLADADPAEWRRWILADADAQGHARLALESQRYLFGRGGWRIGSPVDRPPADIARTLAVGSLAPFLRRGGRVIAYVGMADAVLPPGRIRAALAARVPRGAVGFRLLVVPGMAHCQGGTGATAFGQSLAAAALRDDAGHDVRRALEAWVERGLAPDELTLTGDVGARRLPLHMSAGRRDAPAFAISDDISTKWSR